MEPDALRLSAEILSPHSDGDIDRALALCAVTRKGKLSLAYIVDALPGMISAGDAWEICIRSRLHKPAWPAILPTQLLRSWRVSAEPIFERSPSVAWRVFEERWIPTEKGRLGDPDMRRADRNVSADGHCIADALIEGKVTPAWADELMDSVGDGARLRGWVHRHLDRRGYRLSPGSLSASMLAA